MHRTTINLDESVYRRVKALAERRGRSLARTIEELLRSALEPRGKEGAAVSPPLHQGVGPRPGVDVADRSRLYDLMNEP